MKSLSSIKLLKYFKNTLTENHIVDVNSDLKHRIFPRPFERLSNLKDRKGLVGIEIGVCRGEHAISLLRTLKIDKLYLIDPYEMFDGDSDTYIQALELLKPFGKNIQWVKKFSKDAVNDIKEQLDFIYIYRCTARL